MRYRIEQIKLRPGQPKDLLADAVRKKLRRRDLEIRDLKILRESIDARRKPDVRLVYTVSFECGEALDLPEARERTYRPPFAKEELRAAADVSFPRPVVAGYGPAGMFAALVLARWGLRPVIVERGQPVDDRVRTVEEFWRTGRLDPESNVQFGEGGAGTFSDGKLTTNAKDIRNGFILETFAAAGADPEILYRQKPHIGTDRLRGIVKNIREETRGLGGTFLFSTRLTDVVIGDGGALEGVVLRDAGTGEETVMRTDRLILATGHSAADTFGMLHERGVAMEQKPFSVGVRIEHPQAMIDEAQYGDPELAKLLGPAEYKLNHRCADGRGVYTFCMCPGGRVINSASEETGVVTNGMSLSGRDSGTANSGLLVDVRTEDFGSDHPLAGIWFQREHEQRALRAAGSMPDMPKTTYGRFRADREDIVRACLPEFAGDAIAEAMPHLGRRLRGFDRDDSVLTGVETRSSSPVRITRDAGGMSSVPGIMPAGEGPGYAGGIMSAAADGIRIAEKLVAGRLAERNR